MYPQLDKPRERNRVDLVHLKQTQKNLSLAGLSQQEFQ